MLLQLLFWLSVLTSLGAGQYRRVTFVFNTYRHDGNLCHSRLLANVDWVKLKANVVDATVDDIPVVFDIFIKERDGRSVQICTIDIARDGCRTSNSGKSCYCEHFSNDVHHLVIKYLALWKRSSGKVKIVLRNRNLESDEFIGPPVYHKSYSTDASPEFHGTDKGSELEVSVNSEVVPIGDLCKHYIKFGVSLQYRLCAEDVRGPTVKIIFTSSQTVTGRRGRKCVTGNHISRSNSRYEFSYTDSCGARRSYRCSFWNEEELCSFSREVRGKFISSTLDWTIEDRTITGLSPCRGKAKWDCIPGIYIPDKFICLSTQGNGYYVMSLWWKQRFELRRAHMCLYIQKKSHYKLTYHLGPKEIADAPYNENVIVATRFDEPSASEVCNNPSPGGDEKKMLLRKYTSGIQVLEYAKKVCPPMLHHAVFSYEDQRTSRACSTVLYNCLGNFLTVHYESCLPSSFFKRISNKFYCLENFTHDRGEYLIVGVRRFKIEFQCWNIVRGGDQYEVLVNQGNACSDTAHPTESTKDIVLRSLLTQCTDSSQVHSSASVHVLARKGELPVILIMLVVLACTRPRSEI